MLKIKDDIDLKELEKFGFTEIKFISDGECLGWEWSTIYNDDGEEEKESIYVYPDINKNYKRIMVIDAHVEDKLFDLIQAGLVEKV